jgi:hypothetical protein
MFRPFTKPTQDQLPVPPVLRLVVTPEARPGRFTARLESGEVIVADTRQPLVDGARELIARGFAAGLLLTLRHVGKGYDSLRPQPIGAWAALTYTEGETTPLRRQAWKPRQMPIAAVTGAQKSGFAAGREETCPLGQNRPLVDRLTALEGS